MGLREEQRVQTTHLSEERFKLKMAQVDTPPAFRQGECQIFVFL